MLVLTGMADFQRALKVVDAQAADDFKHVYEDVAKPMAQYATGLELRGIRRMTMAWADNRVGVGARAVWVVPRRRGVKGRGLDPRRRPRFGELIMKRAYEPTAVAFTPRIRADVERALGRMAHTIDRIADG
jgi:hypothetical protein